MMPQPAASAPEPRTSAQYDRATFQDIERKWQAYWRDRRLFAADKDDTIRPKYYVLDMFPYPSGAGLHVGHPLGYIATDILARYKRLQGYNVLHPMGFDAFGLPAENYAIQTGIHPAVSTDTNTRRYLEQIGVIGLGYDPDSLTRTSDPDFYRWTQWTFLQLFDSWYNLDADRAEPIATLTARLDAQGTAGIRAACDDDTPTLSAAEWQALRGKAREDVLQHYRLAYLRYDYVNWCPALGTVLANEEVKDGVSERGGHPVERVRMRQWSLRITAYAERLLEGLNRIEWPAAIVEQQRNWIGRSAGASLRFAVEGRDAAVEVFTTRPDTVFGVSFLVLAPEHPLVDELLTDTQREAAAAYVARAKNRSERDRQADTRTVTGAFTGSYALHPFTGERLPVWIGEYVLIGYGTGAIMAVPGHDERDHAFARTFDLPIRKVVDGPDVAEAANPAKEGVLVNSGFLDGLPVPEAIARAIQEIENRGIGKGRVTYRLRDAIFSRQRYWGEPIPILYDPEGTPHPLPESELPLVLPPVDSYQPSGTGESPLAAITDWTNVTIDGISYRRETNTMPGWAGSSWYFLRYLSVGNNGQLADAERMRHWLPVDLYLGGSEHAVGHLLYARFWTKFLYDRGWCPVDEFAQKLVNQGMIQGRSNLVYRHRDTGVFVSKGRIGNPEDYTPVHVDVNIVRDDVLDLQAFRNWRAEFAHAEFELEDGRYVCGVEVEKMSKSKYNVVNPDDLCREYGADTFRLYEMFLGPLEQSKPWNTNGITGVHNFLKKVWRQYHDEAGKLALTDEAPSAEELKLLHQTIRKVADDCERLSFNTTVPQFMIFINEMARLSCRKRAVLEPFVILLSPYAPHLAEELWQRMGHAESVLHARFPQWDERYLVEAELDYPVSINGKVRGKLRMAADIAATEAEALVRAYLDATPDVAKHLSGPVKKLVVVPGRIVNVVV